MRTLEDDGGNCEEFRRSAVSGLQASSFFPGICVAVMEKSLALLDWRILEVEYTNSCKSFCQMLYKLYVYTRILTVFKHKICALRLDFIHGAACPVHT